MSKKVKCCLCQKEGNILLGHIRNVHDITVEEYKERFPSALLMSEAGEKRHEERVKKKSDGRETVWVSIRKTFSVNFGSVAEVDAKGRPIKINGKVKYVKNNKGKPIPKDNKMLAFKRPGKYTPKIDLSYVFSRIPLMPFIIGLECGDRVLLTGPTGTGKSTLPEQVAARLNYNFVRINFCGGILREDLVGANQYHPDEGTYWQEGILPWAMRQPGTIICFDEWDTISAECSFVLQRPLEKTDGNLLILENGAEQVPLHKQSFFCATANTIGLGDDTGLYSHGTTHQNYAQLNRFGITIFLDYLSPEEEARLLNKKFVEEDGTKILDPTEVEAFTKTMEEIRKGFVKGEISVPLSTRDLLGWVEKFLLTSNVRESAQMCFLNRMPKADAQAVVGMIQRVFELAS